MIQPVQTHLLEAAETLLANPNGHSNFSALFGAAKEVDAAPAKLTASDTPAQGTLGDPDVQDWLNSYYKERAATNPQESASDANVPYQPAAGKGVDSYPAGSVYGPDQVYVQALYNQNDGLFSTLMGQDPSSAMSQLPGIPTQAAQQAWDQQLAVMNAQRLASGQPIDTSAYWSDPGSLNYDGHVYTSAELGYAGPGQSSGPEPIYISSGNQIPGTNNFMVPGYSGIVTGIQPNKFYTLQQLEQAGLKAGQPDTQYHPGSWTLT